MPFRPSCCLIKKCLRKLIKVSIYKTTSASVSVSVSASGSGSGSGSGRGSGSDRGIGSWSGYHYPVRVEH
jgi:hypothetical protein